MNFFWYSNFFRIVPSSIDEMRHYFDEISSDSSFNAALGESFKSLYYSDLYNSKVFAHCRDSLLTIPQVIYTVKDFYLLEAINEKVELLKSAGLIDFWWNQFIETPKVPAQNVPKSLRLHNFDGCFGILFCGSFLGFVTFLIELFMKKFHV